jgi:acid phosphatase family membrane protein YuiD
MMFETAIIHPIVLPVAVTTALCQAWKLIDNSISKKRIDLYAFIMTGGMPSSHSAFVTALAVSVGFLEGFLSTVFLLAAGFALIVVRDSFGLRHAVDNLTKTVNNIIKEKKVRLEVIRKIAGHTPVQAAVGVLIGIIIPTLMHFLVY